MEGAVMEEKKTELFITIPFHEHESLRLIARQFKALVEHVTNQVELDWKGKVAHLENVIKKQEAQIEKLRAECLRKLAEKEGER